MPAFEGMENIQETIAANATPQSETYTDQDGNEATRSLIAFDVLGAVFVGKGGTFNFKSPPVGFTEDMGRTLDRFFILIAYNQQFPEFLWGGAVAQSKASTETQMPPFIRYIQMRRVELDGESPSSNQDTPPLGGMYELVDLFLRMKALTDPRIVVAPVRSAWPTIDIETDTVRLQKVIYADSKGYLRRQTALASLRLVPDAQKEVREADAEAPTLPEDDFMTAVNTAANQQMDAGKRGIDDNKPNRNPLQYTNPAGGDPRRVGELVSESVAGALTALDAALPEGLDGRRLVGGNQKRKRKVQAA